MKMINKRIYYVILLTNIFLIFCYAYECYNFYTDNFTPDGWRFLPLYFFIDIIFFISFLFMLFSQNRRFLVTILGIALLQNLPIGFGISLVSQIGLAFSLLISVFLLYFRKRLQGIPKKISI